jgi:choline dehydrogenase
MMGLQPVAMRFDPNVPKRGYGVIMAAMRPESRGTVKIKSTDPHQPPALRFNYLSTEADRRFWVDAMHIARNLMAQPAFSDIDGGETYPGPEVQTDEEILAWARRTIASNMHPTSTCRMGVDDLSVVDPATMAVRGVEGLSVVDASVMPHCPNSATHAPTLMLATKAADLILGRTPLAAAERTARPVAEAPIADAGSRAAN